MKNGTLIVGCAGVAVGLLIGAIVLGSGTPGLEKKFETSLSDQTEATTKTVLASAAALESQMSGVADSVAALEARIATLEAALAESTEGQSNRADQLAAQLGDVADGLGGQLDDMAAADAEQGEGLKGALEAAVAKIAAIAAAAGQPADGASAAASAPAAAGTPTSAEAGIDGTRAGETLSLLDGKVRVFVSGIDAASGTARVAVNGTGLQTLSRMRDAGFSTGEDACTLSLDAIADGEVAMSAECAAGAAATAAAGTVAALPAPPRSETAADRDGAGVGETAWLLDGAVRIFVSAIDADTGMARVSVNGTGLQMLGGDREVTFNVDGAQCDLILDEIADGRARMSPNCQK